MNTIVDYYSTQIGELWTKSLFDLVGESINGILKTSGVDKGKIDAIFFSNMMAGLLENNLHAAAKIAEMLDVQIPIFRIEAACASGGVAFNLANSYLDAGRGSTVLVVGAEKMNDFSPEQVTSALAAAASGEEQEAGLTFPGLYGMIANYYLSKYQYGEDSLAYVSVKNHFHGTLNEKAHFRRTITVSDVLNSPYVSYPLKVLDSSPISDGAASILLTNDKALIKKSKTSAHVLASEVATDTISLSKRKNIDELYATKVAADKAFKNAKLKRDNIKVCEVHDCFSIAEILAMEDIGFWKKGQGGEIIKQQSTMYGKNAGGLTVNTSGGLKASGHPVGATGIKQIGEIFLQLTNQATKRQLKNPHYGLAHNVGGSGGTAAVTILGI